MNYELGDSVKYHIAKRPCGERFSDIFAGLLGVSKATEYVGHCQIAGHVFRVSSFLSKRDALQLLKAKINIAGPFQWCEVPKGEIPGT